VLNTLTDHSVLQSSVVGYETLDFGRLLLSELACYRHLQPYV
jgi:hypothetical protein